LGSWSIGFVPRFLFAKVLASNVSPEQA